MGLEPTTLGTTKRCSNQLSYIYRLEIAKIEISTRFATSFFGKSGNVERLQCWNVMKRTKQSLKLLKRYKLSTLQPYNF
ncbi:MAG: hypothetical protein JWR02_691 [Mucilaginibacter sp.]|nr:hypothetical protein [Mucilaginibacter sp.]